MTILNYKLLVFDEIDSTNSEAIRIAKRDKPDRNYAVLVKSQTTGRGGNGKNWQSTSSNLHTSLLIKPNKELELLPQLSFVAALAVYDSITYVKPRYNSLEKSIQIQLKWPNDVLVNDKKISGILLESVKVEDVYTADTSKVGSPISGEPAERTEVREHRQIPKFDVPKIEVSKVYYLIIGIGINITYHPASIDQPPTSFLNENLPAILPQDLLEILIANYEKYYQIWNEQGFSFIRETWLKHAYKLDKNITVKHQNNLITGIFKDIDPAGRIILQLSSKKIMSFFTAELSF